MDTKEPPNATSREALKTVTEVLICGGEDVEAPLAKGKAKLLSTFFD